MLPLDMRRRLASIVLVALLLGCSSLTRPDDDVLGDEPVAAQPAVVIAPAIANPTNEPHPTNETNVALAAAQPQPANPPAAKQGG